MAKGKKVFCVIDSDNDFVEDADGKDEFATQKDAELVAKERCDDVRVNIFVVQLLVQFTPTKGVTRKTF